MEAEPDVRCAEAATWGLEALAEDLEAAVVSAEAEAVQLVAAEQAEVSREFIPALYF